MPMLKICFRTLKAFAANFLREAIYRSIKLFFLSFYGVGEANNG